MDERLRKELLRSELKERNKGKKIIRCKYRPKYPDSAEREYVRLINAYMTIEKEVLMKYIPEIKQILNDGTQLHTDSKKDNEKKRRTARFSALDNTIVRLTILFKTIQRELDSAFGLYDLKRQINRIANLDHKLTVREWKKAVSKTLGIDLLDDYYSGEYYAQVECNSVYRAMIHHMITGADVPTDTVVDIFGKFGLAAALCAGGYKYKIVCLNEQNFYLYSLLQDVMRKPVKFYKMIDEERKYLEIKLADNEIKDIMKSQIQHLGQIKVLVYYGVRKNVGGQYSYESTGYTKEQIAKYIFICLCFAPEYWVETNLEVKNNKMVTGWLDDEKTYKKCVTDFVKLSQEDFVAFAKKFSELKFVNCDISRVIDIIRKNADNQNYSSGDIQKFLLYIDVPKYIKEYQRFGFDGTMMISLLKMLHHYEGNWIMTWSTFLQKGLNDENPTLYDMLYTQQEMQSDIYIAHGNYERFEEKVPVKVIYNMFDMIDKDKNLFVFIYRDKNKNKQQNIVFVTDIDFDEIDCESFFRKYKMKFNGKEKLLKLKWREFKKNYVKFS